MACRRLSLTVELYRIVPTMFGFWIDNDLERMLTPAPAAPICARVRRLTSTSPSGPTRLAPTKGNTVTPTPPYWMHTVPARPRPVDHYVSWPALALSVVAVVVAFTSHPWDYQLILITSSAGFVLSGAAFLIDLHRRSWVAVAAFVALLGSGAALVLGLQYFRYCRSDATCAMVDIIG